MEAREVIRLPDPRERVRAYLREVVREVGGRPHVFHRVKLTGWYFPQRAQEPFLLIGDAVSQLVVIAPDGLSAAGYFDRPIPAAKMVTFGYGDIVEWDFPIPVDASGIDRLHRSRLPAGVADPFAEPPPRPVPTPG